MRRLNVRTRLMAVITVPLVLLLAVTVPQLMNRRSRAAGAERAAVISQDVEAVTALADSLQAERTLSAAARAGSGASVSAALAGQRRTSDGRRDSADAALADLAQQDSTLEAPVTAARRALGELDTVRRDTDNATSVVPWVDPFEPVLAPLLDVEEAAGAVANDAGLGTELAIVSLVSRAKEATAQQAATLAAATSWKGLRGDQAGALAGERADETGYLTAAIEASPLDERDARREELSTGAVEDVGRIVDSTTASGTVTATGGLDSWLDQSAQRQQALRRIEGQRTDEAVAAATSFGDDARRASTGFLLLATLGLIIASGLALLASRSITRPLRRLTDAADHLADERLPQLVEALRHPIEDDEHTFAPVEPIEVKSHDELGRLATAFNSVQAVAVDVAAEQANLLRKGISDLYVNLARRNQALIDRQILLLDQLETGEQDPETLEHLYLLDHLATRMRRNAESLLILAGAESGPRRTKPVPVVDVVRAALSEVEEYERVDLGTMAPAVLQGLAVSDVAHLVAELLENATQFSPPETHVRIDGIRTGGSYQLVITDRGVGMREGQLEELNAVLRDPPVTGLALGRSLGCLVAARLAARHEITVRLRAGEPDGVAAYVVLPSQLLVEEVAEPLAPVVDTTITLSEGLGVGERTADAGADGSWEWEDAPVRLRDALPGREEFDAGLQALLERETDQPLIEDPVSEAAGALRQRVPGATAEAVPEPVAGEGTRRSPDEVRALLTRYRSGLQAGRTDGTSGETP